jgi:serine O-acetyltransferase
MIQSREDYWFYRAADEIALGISTSWPRRFQDYLVNDIWHFQRLLRKLEYYINCRQSPLFSLYRAWLMYRAFSVGKRLGFYIPPNVFGPGLSIAHWGTLIVNPLSRVGENCRIHNCVHIATQCHPKGEPDTCPTIGNNVFIGPGAVILGDITIADNCVIGANSYVNSSFFEPGITIAGSPAKKISDKGFERCYFKATELLRKNG